MLNGLKQNRALNAWATLSSRSASFPTLNNILLRRSIELTS
jgi:hypothetical protein